MKIDEKIISELKRHNDINRYVTEQEAALPPAPGEEALPPLEDAGALPPAGAPAPAAGATPPPPAGAPAPAQPVDVENDPDVEKLDDKGEKKDKTKEIEVTDLVKSQKNVEEKQEEYFDSLFKHLEDLESKLANMDTIMSKLNDLEAKVEKYRVKTPEEKLELRSLDSGPFNQKLSDFFDEKLDDMEESGKNEYVLTKDEVENYSPSDIKKSFRNFEPTMLDKDNAFKRIY